MRTKKTHWIIPVFIIMICAPNLIWPLISSRIDTGNYENRDLAAKPEFSLDSVSNLPNEIEDYYDDTLPFRNQLIGLSGAIKYYCFNSSPSDRVVAGKDGWLFYADEDDGDPISCYKGTNLLTDEQLNTISSNLLAARDDLASRGIDFVVFIAPDKERVYSDEMPDYYGEPADSYAVLQIVNYLQENTDLNVVYPVDEIISAAYSLGDNGLLYHKTDTHWNELGAYVGAKALLDSLNVSLPAYNDSSITINESEDEAGDLAGMMGLHSWIEPGKTYIPTGFDKHDLVEDEWDFYNEYSFHANDADPRKIFIHRDSFCTAMAETIGSQFDESIMVYNQAYKRDMISEEKPDIYVFETVERYAVRNMSDVGLIY